MNSTRALFLVIVLTWAWWPPEEPGCPRVLEAGRKLRRQAYSSCLAEAGDPRFCQRWAEGKFAEFTALNPECRDELDAIENERWIPDSIGEKIGHVLRRLFRRRKQ